MKHKNQSSIEVVDVDKLELDPENPRLPDSVIRKSDEMLRYIARETSIEELMGAIAEHGFFSGEPLIVCKAKKGGSYRVVEGNRRLVAVMLLRDPDLIPKRKKVREISETSKNTPEKLPVVIFDEREEVLNYLGYRHITGIKQWDSLAKARYMHQLFLHHTQQKATPQQRYQEVAKAIGSRPDYVKKILDSLALYKIIADKNFYGISNLEDGDINFSLIPTAIAQTNFKEFLSIQGDPIIDNSKINRENLKDFVHWVFAKDQEGKKRVGESRELKKLAHVVANQVALKEFKGGLPLDEAFKLTKGIDEDFQGRLVEAELALQSANGNIANIKDIEPYRDQIKRIYNQANQLNKTARSSDSNDN